MTGDELEPIFAAIEARRGLDLRDYQRDAVLRGIDARVAARGLSGRVDYAGALSSAEGELDALVATLDIPVTRFFRAPPVFDALDQRVLPSLMRAAAPSALRIACLAAATGEEAWSLAMLATVVAERLGLPPATVLGTDIDRASLATAERGVYPAAALDDVPAELRARFFSADGASQVRIAEELRARVRFAEHDAVGTALMPPGAVVASFHLVTLRNLLIYLDRRLQEKALDRVAAVLEPGGGLVLSRIESVPAALADRFEPWPGLPPALRIFRRRS